MVRATRSANAPACLRVNRKTLPHVAPVRNLGAFTMIFADVFAWAQEPLHGQKA